MSNDYIKDVPIHHVMAFNSVSAPCHVGVAMGWRIDCSMDDEAPIELVVMAKDIETLRRFKAQQPGLKKIVDKTNYYPVAMAQQRHLKIMKAADMQYNTAGLTANDDEL